MTTLTTPIRELPNTFIGKGEVSGDQFSVIMRSDKAYIYRRVSMEGTVYFEVFRRKMATSYPDTSKKIVLYPKSAAFGVWAWTYRNINDADKKFNELNSIALLKER